MEKNLHGFWLIEIIQDYGENERNRAVAKFLKEISFHLVKKIDYVVNKSKKDD